MGIGAAIAIFALLGVLGYIRLAPSDASWHVDPTTVTVSTKPNHWLVRSLVLEMSAADAATKLVVIAQDTPRTALLAGQGLHTTWITRTAIMGYPDYTSVMIAPTATGCTISIYARARFGQSDFGVNRARVESWLAQLVAATG